MHINTYNQEKITKLSFVLIFLVVLAHSYYVEAENYATALAIQNILGTNGIARVAVPMFFTISGFLFFKSVTKRQECFPKIMTRVRTLLIPYILWNCIYVFWFVVLGYLPGMSSYTQNNVVTSIITHGYGDALTELFITPIAFHLWFLRDLIVYVFLSPIFYLVCKRLSWLTPILLAALSIFSINLLGAACFSLGAVVALCCDIEKVNKFLSIPIVGICLLAFSANAVWQIHGGDFHPYYTFLINLCGIITFWRLYDLWSQRISSNLLPASFLCYSFFIYCFHEPTFNIIKKLTIKLLGTHEWGVIALYIINPFIMCTISILIAKFSKRIFPKTYAVLTGAR